MFITSFFSVAVAFQIAIVFPIAITEFIAIIVWRTIARREENG